MCDLDDGPDRRPAVDVVRVAVGGVAHDLDLCQEHVGLLLALDRRGAGTSSAHADAAEAVLSAAGTRGRPSRAGTSPATGRPVTSRRKPGSRRDRQAEVAAARDWARANGRDVAVRGRLPAGLLDEFRAASRQDA